MSVLCPLNSYRTSIDYPNLPSRKRLQLSADPDAQSISDLVWVSHILTIYCIHLYPIEFLWISLIQTSSVGEDELESIIFTINFWFCPRAMSHCWTGNRLYIVATMPPTRLAQPSTLTSWYFLTRMQFLLCQRFMSQMTGLRNWSLCHWLSRCSRFESWASAGQPFGPKKSSVQQEDADSKTVQVWMVAALTQPNSCHTYSIELGQLWFSFV